MTDTLNDWRDIFATDEHAAARPEVYGGLHLVTIPEASSIN